MSVTNKMYSFCISMLTEFTLNNNLLPNQILNKISNVFLCKLETEYVGFQLKTNPLQFETCFLDFSTN